MNSCRKICCLSAGPNCGQRKTTVNVSDSEKRGHYAQFFACELDFTNTFSNELTGVLKNCSYIIFEKRYAFCCHSRQKCSKYEHVRNSQVSFLQLYFFEFHFFHGLFKMHH